MQHRQVGWWLAATLAPLAATLLASGGGSPHATRTALMAIAAFGLVTAAVGLAALHLLDPLPARARLAGVAVLAPVALSCGAIIDHVVDHASDPARAVPSSGCSAVLTGVVVLGTLLIPRGRIVVRTPWGPGPAHDPVAAGTLGGLVLGVVGALADQRGLPPGVGHASTGVTAGSGLLVGGAVLLAARRAELEPLVVAGLVAGGGGLAAAAALTDDVAADVGLLVATTGLVVAVRGLIVAVRPAPHDVRTGGYGGTNHAVRPGSSSPQASPEGRRHDDAIQLHPRLHHQRHQHHRRWRRP